MNEAREIAREVLPSDALKLCNALGWSAAEFCGHFGIEDVRQFFTVGLVQKSPRRKQSSEEFNARKRAYYLANRERILAQQLKKRREKFRREIAAMRGETSYQARVQAKIF